VFLNVKLGCPAISLRTIAKPYLVLDALPTGFLRSTAALWMSDDSLAPPRASVFGKLGRNDHCSKYGIRYMILASKSPTWLRRPALVYSKAGAAG